MAREDKQSINVHIWQSTPYSRYLRPRIIPTSDFAGTMSPVTLRVYDEGKQSKSTDDAHEDPRCAGDVATTEVEDVHKQYTRLLSTPFSE